MTRRINTAQSQVVNNGIGIQSGNYTWTSTKPLVQNHPTQLAESFKPKRAGKKTSHVVFVLDDSGSMQSCRDTTISGYNEYLQMQKKDARETGIPTYVSLYKFDGSSVTALFNRIPVNEVSELNRDTYNPRGGTNLYDAIGGVMMQINSDLQKHKKADRDSVIVTILTDGEENSSRTFDSANIKIMVEKAEAKNWGFMFLGANINAFAASSLLGFNTNNTMQYTSSNMAETIRSASAMTSRMKAAYASGMETSATYASVGFTDQERALAVGETDDKKSI